MKHFIRALTLTVIASVVTGCIFFGCDRAYMDKDYDSTIFGTNEESEIIGSEKVKLSIMSSSIVESPEGEVERELMDEFMQLYPNIELEVIGVPMNNATNAVTTCAISGELPDIFVNALELMPRFYDLGLCLDLKDYLDEEYLSGFYPYVMQEVVINDEMQFFPRFSLTMAVVYRKDWFEEKGISEPKSWDEFVAAAQQLTEDVNQDGQIDRWGFAMVGSKNSSGTMRFINILRSFGAYEVRYENGEWYTSIASDQGKAAFRFFGDLYGKYNVVPPGPLEVNYEEAIAMMASEKTGMMITGQNSLGAILKLNPELDGKLGSFVIPKADHHTSTLSIIGYSISKDCANVDEAITFLKFICNKENLIKWNQETGRMPVRVDAGSDPSIQRPGFEGFNEAYNYIEPIPQVSFYADMTDIIGEAYQSILIDSVDLDTAVEAAATRIRQSIEQSPSLIKP